MEDQSLPEHFRQWQVRFGRVNFPAHLRHRKNIPKYLFVSIVRTQYVWRADVVIGSSTQGWKYRAYYCSGCNSKNRMLVFTIWHRSITRTWSHPQFSPQLHSYVDMQSEIYGDDPRTLCTVWQGGGDVTTWILQTSLSDPNYRHLDLWEILDYHLVEIGEHHHKDTPQAEGTVQSD
jgi:hypothetical protein